MPFLSSPLLQLVFLSPTSSTRHPKILVPELVSAVKLVVVMMVGPTVEMRMPHKPLVNKENKKLVPVVEVLPVEADRVPEAVVEVLHAKKLLSVAAASKPIAACTTQTAQKSTATNGSIKSVNKLVVVVTESSVHQDKAAAQVKALSNVPMVAVIQPVKHQPPHQLLLIHRFPQVPSVQAIKKSVLTPFLLKHVLMATGAALSPVHHSTPTNQSVSTVLVSPPPPLMDEKQTLPIAPPLVQTSMAVFAKPTTASLLKMGSLLMVISVALPPQPAVMVVSPLATATPPEESVLLVSSITLPMLVSNLHLKVKSAKESINRRLTHLHVFLQTTP